VFCVTYAPNLQNFLWKKKIVFAGGPATGKTTLIQALELRGYACAQEVSRQVTLEARENGISQFFVSDPLLFSEKLLEGRINQYKEAQEHKASMVFLDRGLPEVVAYLDRGNTPYPNHFSKACEDHQYDRVFIFPPWEEIYTPDNERYEDYQEALKIYPFLKAAYDRFGYESIILPKDTVENRISFVLENI